MGSSEAASSFSSSSTQVRYCGCGAIMSLFNSGEKCGACRVIAREEEMFTAKGFAGEELARLYCAPHQDPARWLNALTDALDCLARAYGYNPPKDIVAAVSGGGSPVCGEVHEAPLPEPSESEEEAMRFGVSA